MDKEVIKVRQSVAIILLFVTGEFSILASGLAAKKDSWISVLIAIGFSTILMFVYLGILKLKLHQNYLDALLNVFGKYIGKIVIAFYAFYFFDLIGLVLRDFVQFAEVTSYDNTPIIIPGIFMMILCVWVLKKGLVTLCRWAEFFIYIPYSYILITAFFLIPELDINNIKPLMYNGITPVLHGAYEIFIYPFGEAVVFLVVLLYMFDVKKIKKISYMSIFISAIYIFIMSIFIMMIIGENYASSLTFTSYGVAKMIKLGFLERTEILAAIVFMIGIFAKVSIYLLATCMCIEKLLELNNYKNIVIPVGALSLNFIIFSFDSVIEFNEWIFEVWIYFAFVFIVIFPVLLLIAGNIKKLLQKGKR